jgi:glucose/arabinose dehydrogenase
MIFSNQQKSQITFSLGNAEIWTGLETITPKSNYGKIMNISLTTGRVTDISSGHRNPQGLCYLENQLYSSEQGPDGGDEVNAIARGKDYGWPAVSYGMPYGEFVSDRVKGRNFASHEGYEKPLISWAPAIAAGDLICPNSRVKGAWTRNFLLATLKDSSIRRLVLDSGAIRVDERIPLGFRIRDILITKSGQLLALTDEGSVIEIKLIDR